MPEIQIPSYVITGLQVILAFSGAFVIALWVSMIVWTFKDARSRSRDIFSILLATLMVIVFGPLGMLLYILLRPPVTLAELYERSLEEEALLQDLEERPRCPGCSRQVKEEWIICPDCHTSIKNICQTCQQPLHLVWSICPYCATSVQASTNGQHQVVTQPVAVVAASDNNAIFAPPDAQDDKDSTEPIKQALANTEAVEQNPVEAEASPSDETRPHTPEPA